MHMPACAAHLELVAQGLAIDLGRHALIVESAQLGVVINLQLLLAPRGGVCDVELHDAAARLHGKQQQKQHPADGGSSAQP